jgi:hypothetical protein
LIVDNIPKEVQMSKLIAVLGVVTAVAFAVAPQFDALSPQVTPWLMLLGTLAAAVAGALTKFGGKNVYVTIIGVGVAGASVLAGAVDVLPANVVSVAGIVGTALAAMGRSLFPMLNEPNDEEEAE